MARDKFDPEMLSEMTGYIFEYNFSYSEVAKKYSGALKDLSQEELTALQAEIARRVEKLRERKKLWRRVCSSYTKAHV